VLSNAGKSPFLRRKAIEFLRHINERTDKVLGGLAIILLASILVDHFSKTSSERWIELALKSLHVFIAVLLIFYFICRQLMRDSTLVWGIALTNEDCTNLRNWLRTGEAPEQNSCCCMYEYASEHSLNALVKMNYEGFKDSSFGVNEVRLRERNSSWIARNPKLFMLMLDPLTRREFVGYSCLLPLNKEGANLYLAGKLKDEDVPALFVAGASEPTIAVVIFAIVLRPEFSLAKSGASKRYGMYFYSCIFRHAVELYGGLDVSGGVPALYAQTEHWRIARRLEKFGFVCTKTRSAEGFYFWKLDEPLKNLLATKTGEKPRGAMSAPNIEISSSGHVSPSDGKPSLVGNSSASTDAS
jgi:hypothetical protein